MQKCISAMQWLIRGIHQCIQVFYSLLHDLNKEIHYQLNWSIVGQCSIYRLLILLFLLFYACEHCRKGCLRRMYFFNISNEKARNNNSFVISIFCEPYCIYCQATHVSLIISSTCYQFMHGFVQLCCHIFVVDVQVLPWYHFTFYGV